MSWSLSRERWAGALVEILFVPTVVRYGACRSNSEHEFLHVMETCSADVARLAEFGGLFIHLMRGFRMELVSGPVTNVTSLIRRLGLPVYDDVFDFAVDPSLRYLR
jgi:hypothetical protein